MNKKQLIIWLILLNIGCRTHRMIPVEVDLIPTHPEERPRKANIQLNNLNGGNNLTWQPEDDEDEYIIEMVGNKMNTMNDGIFSPPKVDTIKNYNRFNDALKQYSHAQFYLYRKDYDSAMYAINQSLNIMQTSEALALKGSILFIKGLNIDAETYWLRARDIDSTIVIPEIEH